MYKRQPSYTSLSVKKFSSFSSRSFKKIASPSQVGSVDVYKRQLDDFGFNRLNIEVIVKGEQLTHKKNQYGLSVVNGLVFHNDYFVFENKAYLYNILTNIIPVSFGDVTVSYTHLQSESMLSAEIIRFPVLRQCILMRLQRIGFLRR